MQFDYINKWHGIRHRILRDYVYVKTLYTLSQNHNSAIKFNTY